MNENRKELIKAVLLSFKITTYDFEEIRGTTVTLYKFRPQIGVRVSRIRGLKDELAATLCVPSVRIIAPMEDGSVGIEVPNKDREVLQMSDILNSWEYQNTAMELPCAIGRTVTNEIFMADLAEMPHLLVAGATGQGKSVGLNVILMSLLHKKTPDELRLVLIDPKKVELNLYSKIESSYLASPVITEPEDAEQKLQSVCDLMDERYELLSSVGVRNIKEYNALSIVEKLPYVVVVIDEYGDLVMTSGKQMERAICRIAQKARAVGIHMIISTQRPSATIVTGNIKANFPTRIAFRTTTGTDSRVILDQTGAERLTGKGDMIFFSGADTTRMQCAYVTLDEVNETCNDINKRYADHKSTTLLKEPEEQQVYVHEVRLTAPIHRFTKAAAFIVADQQAVSEAWVKVNAKLDFMDARRVFNQLIELGIVESCKSPHHVPNSQFRRVLMHNKDEISRLIDMFS
jgi:S-DNA-T family DNA segregation ATPase FtsK/SpoIIIE